MFINNDFKLVQYLDISSEEDIKQIADGLDIYEIAKFSDFSVTRLEAVEQCLDLGEIFKEAYLVSLGFSPCKEVIEELDAYQRLLENSLGTCENILPLLLTSFKCHQSAMTYYKNGEIDLAIEAMEKTGKIANKMKIKYAELKEGFSFLADQISDTAFSLEEFNIGKDRVWIKTILTAKTGIVNIGSFYGRASSSCFFLVDPDLANPLMVDTMLYEKESTSTSAYEIFEVAEKILTQTPSRPRKSLDEVVKSMKTGATELDSPMQTPLTDMLKLHFPQGIEANFENSYLSWLALAKVNQVMINSIKEVRGKLQQAQKDISVIEKDPLAIALQSVSYSPNHL